MTVTVDNDWQPTLPTARSALASAQPGLSRAPRHEHRLAHPGLMMTDTILSTTLGGALQRRPDGWYWRDGTPESRVRDMLLNDIAPNFA